MQSTGIHFRQRASEQVVNVIFFSIHFRDYFSAACRVGPILSDGFHSAQSLQEHLAAILHVSRGCLLLLAALPRRPGVVAFTATHDKRLANKTRCK